MAKRTVKAATDFTRKTLDAVFSALDLQPATDLEVQGTFVLATSLLTAAAFYYYRRKKESQKDLLKKKLTQYKDMIKSLEKNLQDAELALIHDEKASQLKNKKQIRVFMEGAFDVFHYGHANAFRLGRNWGTCLVVGVNSSKTIEEAKGAPPIMTDEERINAVSGCKFVDEVVPNVPYVMTQEYLDWVIEEYNIDFVIHGDDPCIVNGKDVYAHVKERGMFRSIPRTEGVSTTEIIGRMLVMTKDHHMTDDKPEKRPRSSTGLQLRTAFPTSEDQGFHRKSKFLTTSRMLFEFSHPIKTVKPNMKVVYVAGGWDMFHAGHVAMLREARKLGDFLLVGIYNDGILNFHRGKNYPILNLQERTLNVLQCKYVDDVIIDPPWAITEEMIASCGISVVVRGTKDEGPAMTDEQEDAFFKGAKDKGIFRVIQSQSDLSVQEIVRRVIRDSDKLNAKILRKKKAETDFYKDKHGLSDDFQFGTS